MIFAWVGASRMSPKAASAAQCAAVKYAEVWLVDLARSDAAMRVPLLRRPHRSARHRGNVGRAHADAAAA
jgi:hypothetical protein